MSRKFTSTTAGASILLVVLALLSRGIGFIREVVFAGNFGLGKDFDIYLVGAVLPVTIDTIIFYVGQNFLIPLFNNYPAQTGEAKERFVRFNFWFFTGAGLLAAAVLFLFTDVILNIYLEGSPVDVKDKAAGIFKIFLITIPLAVSVSVLTAYLHNRFKFSSPGIARLLLNFTIIAAVMIFGNRFDIYIIPLGYVAGNIIQLSYLLIKSELKISGKFFSGEALGSVLKTSFLFAFLTETVSQLYTVIDRYFIGSVEEGGIAALNYAQTLYMLPVSVITIALSTAILPKLSKGFTSAGRQEVEQTYNDGLRIILSVFIPLTIIFYFYGDDLIRIIYQRGNFDKADTVVTYNTLKYFALSLAFYSSYSITNKLMYSANLTAMLFAVTLSGTAVKIIFNYLLVDYLKQDGLAASTSISFFFFFMSSVLIIFLRGIIRKFIFFQELVFHLLNSLLSLIFVMLLSSLFPYQGNINGCLEVLLFSSIYIFNFFMLKSRSADLIASALGGLLKK